MKIWPDDLAKGSKPENDQVMHVHLKIGNSELMLADTLPGQPYKNGPSITNMIAVKEMTRAEKYFTALLADGIEIMPLQETSFSPAIGQVRDKFGVEWQIVTEHPDMREIE